MVVVDRLSTLFTEVIVRSPLCSKELAINLVERDNEKHQNVEHAVQHHSKQIELDLFEEATASLHIDIDQSWTLQGNELVLRREKVKLTAWV